MSKKRVHELAKEFGLETREVVELLEKAGLGHKTASSSVDEDEARAILTKSKAPAAAAPAGSADTAAAAPKRVGMMIVKKKSAEVAAPVSAPAPVEASQTSEAAAPAEATQPADLPEAERPFDAQTGALEQTPPADSVSVEGAADMGLDASAGADEGQAEGDAAPGEESAATSSGAGQRPGAAQVVRMIDRDKLLERIPTRRLTQMGMARPGGAPARPGAAPAGAPRPAGQRFGEVTELKVVQDPYGRGREMIDVGRAKKPAGPAASKVVKKERLPTKRELMDMRERAMHPSRLKKKKTIRRVGGKTELTQMKASKRVIRMKDSITVGDLAHQMGVKATELIAKLMGLGMMVTVNQGVDFDTAQLLANEYQFTVEKMGFDEEAALEVAEDAPETLQPRPPVVTVMGHVDHGKTSLLDAIRKARVAAGEAGGITQHIGAYQVEVPGKGTITFLDTPGHAAFTQMRARGAQVTDLVILVVAADDGVMPQTIEAIQHAQAAEVPIIVAVNKCDKPEAQPERVMQELTKYNLLSEAWGGDTLFVNTSAVKGTGIPELLEAVLLQAEVLELKANPDRQALGIVIEAQLDKGRGPVATVLVQTGTLKHGDPIVAGEWAGRVRAMINDQGVAVKTAGPSAAVEVIGLEGVPAAGDQVNSLESPEAAREVAEHRQAAKRTKDLTAEAPMSLEDMMKRMAAGEQLELKVVLKADVQGSVEAIRDALVKLSTNEVKVNVVSGGVGGIKESDIMLAAASKGIVVGFGVRPDPKGREIAEREGVEIRTYTIIYELLDDVRKAMEGLLAPESREKFIGRAEVREAFHISKVGTIAGSKVVDGKAQRNARVRVLRDNVQVFDGKVASLKRFKDDVREVETGMECGIGVEGFNDIKPADVIEFYVVEEVARTLAAAAAPSSKRPGGGGAPAHA